MLIYKRTEEEQDLQFDGNGFDLIAEATFMVNKIFNCMYRQDPASALAFRSLFRRLQPT